jgi:hypothetical protein
MMLRRCRARSSSTRRRSSSSRIFFSFICSASRFFSKSSPVAFPIGYSTHGNSSARS